jgi:hypothetical protein
MKKPKLKLHRIDDAAQNVPMGMLGDISGIAAGLATRDNIDGNKPWPDVVAREAIAIYCEIIDQLTEKITDA